LVLAIQDVIDKGRSIARELAGVAAADIAFTDGRFVAHGRPIDWSDIVGHTGMLVGQGRFSPPSPTFPNGCHACEVEIHPDDGSVTILSYVVVDDVGQVLHPAIVEGQLHGGIAQGIGEVMQEAVRYDHITSQLLSGSLMDYSIPRAADLPPFLSETCSVPTSINPLGVKGVGEAGIVGALPAVVNAICDALAPLGIEHLDMPFTAEQIWAAIQRADAA
jgi:carbon-monoxide dehydrogenase large subunit